jgi:hypothetical protein
MAFLKEDASYILGTAFELELIGIKKAVLLFSTRRLGASVRRR